MENNEGLSDSESKNLDKFLKKVAKAEQPKIRRRVKKDHTMEKHLKLNAAIASVLSEYCDCYLFLGFDNQGLEIILINSAGNMERRALSDLLSEFIEQSNFLNGFEGVDDDDESGEEF